MSDWHWPSLLGFRKMEAMTKHRSHSAAFKRQVVEEFVAGGTLHALSKRRDISRQLTRHERGDEAHLLARGVNMLGGGGARSFEPAL